MNLSPKQTDHHTDNIEKTSVIDSIVNITDNPNHLTLDSMSKHLASNFVLPNHEDNFAKYITNYNFPSMDFNTDNFNHINTVSYSKNLELPSKTSDQFRSFSQFNNNTIKFPEMKMEPSETLDHTHENEEFLKKYYEDNQLKIEKALMNKNRMRKNSYKKSKMQINNSNNHNFSGSVASKTTQLTAKSNFLHDYSQNKKSYKEFSEIRMTGNNKSIKSLDENNEKVSKFDKSFDRSIKEFCKKKFGNLTEKFELVKKNNINPSPISNHSENMKGPRENFINQKQLFTKQVVKSCIKLNKNKGLTTNSINNLTDFGIKPKAPSLINYSSKNPLKIKLSPQEDEIMILKHQIKLLDSKIKPNFDKLSQLGAMSQLEISNDEINVNELIQNKENLKEVKREINSYQKENFTELINKEKSNIRIASSNSVNCYSKQKYDIKEIYNKRERILSKKSAAENTIYSKSVKWKKNITERNQALKENMELTEIMKYTFTPKISNIYNQFSKNRDSNLSFYEKNLIWKQDVEKSKQEIFIEKERKNLEECYFYPNYFKRSYSSINLNRRKLSNSSYYQKNIEWLMKNKNLKTNLEFEIEENRNKLQKNSKVVFF